MFQYQYPHPAVTVDCAVFGLEEDTLKVLLIQRGLPPYEGCWALPGGFVHLDEGLEEAAQRELREETGLDRLYLEQLYTFGSVDRDPRERVVTVAYFAIVKVAEHLPEAASDARKAAWFPLDDLPDLAFDHGAILGCALRRLQGKIRYQAVGFEFLPEKFTLTQVQKLHETILRQKLDKRNFRKKILGSGILIPLEEVETGVARRPARLFRFDTEAIAHLSSGGFPFEI